MARSANRPPPNEIRTRRNSSMRQASDDILESDLTSSTRSVSYSSDKENHASSARRTNGSTKRMSQLPTPSSLETSASNSNKRRKLGERGGYEPSQAAARLFYDPEQPMDERRAVRKNYRDLSRELADSRADYLAPKSTGLADTINKANDIFTNVRQTSDATLDSRILVAAGDLSARRATQNKLGGVSAGVDVDELVSKTIAFMRRGPSDGDADIARPTQSRRRQDDEFDLEASDDEGDALNWEWLGRKACYPSNIRPPVPGFLLGPLSVQKRVRKQTQRTQRLQKRDPAEATRPDELKVQDIEKAENANLTMLCKRIYELLHLTMFDGREQSEAEIEALDDEEDDAIGRQRIYDKYHIADDGGVCLYHFAFHPTSFSQTVENLFYVSFLIRDGLAGVGRDTRGLTTLRQYPPPQPGPPRRKFVHPPSRTAANVEITDSTTASTPQEIKEKGIVKHQAVFHLDFETWEEIVREFGIEACLIPHRESDRGQQVGAKGWYG